MKKMSVMLLGGAFMLLGMQSPLAADQIVKLGYNLPLSGEFKIVGENAKHVGEMIKEQIMAEGGLKVGGKVYSVDFIYGNNSSTPSGASNQVLTLASKEEVIGIIGPLSSRQAIPAGEVANAFGVPMISSWSTSPATTKDRPFVFRSGYLIGIQAPILTKFARKEFGATKAAVLYDIVSTYPRYMAKDFKAVFEEVNGPGSIKAYEEFRTGDTSFDKQLKAIVASDAEILFTPQHYNEVPGIVRQARKMGWNKPIIGSNSWAGGDLSSECGSDCNGLFFVGNYAAGGAEGSSKEFAEAYKEKYGVLPDEVAGLTWDAVWIVLKAIQATKGLTGDLIQDRKLIRDRLIEIKNYEGVSGTMSFNESGDPEKCAMMIRIAEDGLLTRHETICP